MLIEEVPPLGLAELPVSGLQGRYPPGHMSGCRVIGISGDPPDLLELDPIFLDLLNDAGQFGVGPEGLLHLSLHSPRILFLLGGAVIPTPPHVAEPGLGLGQFEADLEEPVPEEISILGCGAGEACAGAGFGGIPPLPV